MSFGTAIPVGSGGSSRVLRVFDEQRGCEVALKLLHSDDPAMVERLRREVAIQATLDHPHIARIHEIIEYQGRPCAVMPFIDGEPLDRVAAALPLAARLTLMLPVIDAVHAAHRAGLVHRDLKPANVLVEKRADGGLFPYVLDFGVALDSGSKRLTATGEVIGTPGYLSPEQAEGRPDVDRRSDVFSLGVMLYELIAGRLPFDDESVAGVLVAVLRRDPPPLRRFCPQLAPALERIVTQCLEKDSRLRYDSARALHADLEAFLDGRRVTARNLGARYRLRRWVRRRPVLATALSAALLLLVSSAALAVHGQLRASRSAALAAEFSRLSAELGRDMQLVQMRPAHDISQARSQLRQRLEPIRSALRDSDATVRAAAAEPFGFALLALGDEEEALAQLQQVWRSDALAVDDADCRRCPLAAAIGGILERRYRQGMARLGSIAEADLREREAQRLREALLQPARELLAVAEPAADESSLLARALLAHHDGRSIEAIALLEAQTHGASLTPLVLAAELRLAAAVAAAGSGGGTVGDALDEAEAGFVRLIDIARSLPAARLGLCAVGELRLRQGGSSTDQEAATLDACQAAAALDPEDIALRLALAQGHAGVARARAVRGEDPAPAVTAVRQTLDGFADDDGRAALILAQSLLSLAHYGRSGGLDSTPVYAEAAALASAAVERAPGDIDVLLSLAAIQLQIATRNSTDPLVFEPLYASAAELLEQLDQRFPGAPGVALRRGELLAWWGSARNQTDGDAAPLLRQSIALLQPLSQARPDDVAVLARLAFAHWSLGGYLADGGESGEADLAAAEALFERALNLQPSRFVTAFNLISVRLQRSRGRLLAGDSSADVLARADAALATLEQAGQNVAILRASWRVLMVQQAQHAGQAWQRLAQAASSALEAALAQPADRPNAAAQWTYLKVLELAKPPASVSARAQLQATVGKAQSLHAEFPDHATLALHNARLLVRAAEIDPQAHADAARIAVSGFAQRHPRRFAAWRTALGRWVDGARRAEPAQPVARG